VVVAEDVIRAAADRRDPADKSRFAQWGRSFGAEGITITNEAEVADGIARPFAFKTRPVAVHCLTLAVQMSAWRRYIRMATLPRRRR
jgi:hypothetical protein